MDFAAATPNIRELVDEYLFELINLDAPDWYISHAHRCVLNAPDAPNVEVKFAPGLLDVLEADAPPSFDYFTSLPRPDGKHWGVYAFTMTKEGYEPALCIGSGTNAKQGYKSRIAHYYDKKHPTLPSNVRKFHDKGYDMAHIGLLCWSDIPAATVKPRIRQRFLALEGTFTNLFYSAVPTDKDALWVDLMPWQRNDIAWLPLNSHSAFREKAADLTLTPLELFHADESRRQRDHVVHAGVQLRARESKRFHCDECDKDYADQYNLDEHLQTALHRDQVDINIGLKTKKPRHSRYDSQRNSSASVKQSKKHYCKPCDKSFPRPSKLTNHLNGNKHKAVVARLAREAFLAGS